MLLPAFLVLGLVVLTALDSTDEGRR